jgi:hypothetical protein
MTTATRPTLTKGTTPRTPTTVPKRVQDPVALAVAAATAYLEIRAGRRPARQIDRLLAPVLRAEIASVIRERRLERTPLGGISVLRVVTSQPSPSILDAVVVCKDGTTHTSVAIRVEFRRSGWSLTALSTPEDQALLRRRDTS